MMGKNKKCWLASISNVINKRLGLKHLWENQGSTRVHFEIRKITSNLQHIFEFQWHNALTKTNQDGTGNKLRTYNKFKSSFIKEAYLCQIRDYIARKNITRFRISAHHLRIETGRYTRPVTLLQDRVCRSCNVIEDECHIIMDCKDLIYERNIMLNEVENTYAVFTDLSQYDKFIFIMRVGDFEMVQYVSKFLDSVAKKRGRI